MNIFSYGKTEREPCWGVTLGWLSVFYSYKTPVAFEIKHYNLGSRLAMSMNIWSRTTGKHLNYIRQGRKTENIFVMPNEEFNKLLNLALSMLPPLTEDLCNELFALMGDKLSQNLV